MAPNRKQLNLLATSLADLDLVQPKAFLPLTHLSEQAQQTTTVKEAIRTPAATESASYWDWPADVPEEPKDLFSASSVEANLIKDSQSEPSTNVVRASDVAESDDYWSERVEGPESTTTKPQHDSYWSWPADPKEARIQAILKDEEARQQLSTAKIVLNLVKAGRNAPCSQAKPESDSYWTWDSSPDLVVSEALDEVYSQSYWEWKSDDRSKAEINKSELIQSILQAEACRQAVSLAKIEENLRKSVLPESCAVQASSDDYWSWSAPVDKGYWDWSAKPMAAAGQGYWDW